MYLVSDILYLIVYYLVRYRRRVVAENLAACYPDKGKKELRRIERRYYRNMSDLLVESVWNFFLTPPQLKRRFRFKNTELINKYYEQGRSVLLVSAHKGNWEYMGSSLNMQLRHRGIAISKPLENKVLSKWLTDCRARYGTEIIEMAKVLRNISFYEKYHVPCAVMMLCDQSPTNPHKSYWTNFFGRDTAFLYGFETIAQKYNYPVFFYSVDRVKRGHYEVTFELMCDTPKGTPKNSLVEQYVRLLEEDIRRRPEMWLWSHRRWKLTRNGRILKDGTLKIIKP